MKILERTANFRGDALISSILAIALVGVLMMAITSSLSSFNKISKKKERVIQLESRFESVMAAVENDDSWKVTVTTNGFQMNCLENSGQVCALLTRNFNVYLQDGTLLSRGNPALGIGFDEFGNNCIGFDIATPNNACPFAFEITWRPICGGVCPGTVLSITNQVALNPKVLISIKILRATTDPAMQNINMNRFVATFTRGQHNGTLAANCRALMGNFNTETKQCVIQLNTCPAGDMFAGFDATGAVVCRKNGFLDRNCEPGFAMIAVKSGGGYECSKF